jgi:phospholipid/cholesterol/gamma-HCH transport system substrate-binding protein
MDEQRWYFWRVGLVVVIAAVAFSIMIVMFSDIFQTQYTINIRFREAPGVTKDTPVRKHGITIGRVRTVRLLDDGVLLTCGIDSNTVIYEDEVCQIKTASFLGDAELAFLPGVLPAGEVRKPLGKGDLVRNVAVAPNPLEIIDVFIDLRDNMARTLDSVASAGESIKSSSDNIAKITGLVGDVLSEGQGDFQEFVKSAQRLGNKSELAIDNFNSIMADISELVGDKEIKSSVSETVRRIPELVKSAESTLAEVRTAIEPFKGVGSRVDVNLQQIESFTKALGEEGPAVIQDVRESVAKIETLIANVEQFTEQLKQKDGTVGKLFTDPQAYERLNASLANIERITVQVQPLIADFRVFADSLARDPSQLGVKGALQRTSGAGTKGGLLGRFPGSATPGGVTTETWPTESDWSANRAGYWPSAESWSPDKLEPSAGWHSEPWIEPQVPADVIDEGRRFPRLFPQLQRPQWSPRM